MRLRDPSRAFLSSEILGEPSRQVVRGEIRSFETLSDRLRSVDILYILVAFLLYFLRIPSSYFEVFLLRFLCLNTAFPLNKFGLVFLTV